MTSGQPPGAGGWEPPTQGQGESPTQGHGGDSPTQGGQQPGAAGQPAWGEAPGGGQPAWGEAPGAGQQAGGWGQPGYGQQAGGWGQGYGQQGGWGQPGYGQPYGQPGGYYGYPSYQSYVDATQGPGNSAAVGGFITSVASLGLLVTFIGFSAPLTIFGSIAGAIVSRKGVKNVDNGETKKNRDLGQWGFWLGITGIALALIAIAAWIAIIVIAEDSSDDYEYSGFEVVARGAVAVLARAAAA